MILGGAELKDSEIDNALLLAMNIASDMCEPNYDDGTEGWINPIFIVPGSICQPDFEGYQLGYFSKKRKGLVVMIAVPQSVADGENIPEFIGNSLRQAVLLAHEKFKKKGMPFSTLKAEKIIMAIESELQNMS